MCALTGAPRASAQTANFSYTGVPASITPGSSFTFDITLNFTSGTLANVQGLSYWLYQVSPGAPPYNFAITLRDVTGSLFQPSGPPLTLSPNPRSGKPQWIDASDLGGWPSIRSPAAPTSSRTLRCRLALARRSGVTRLATQRRLRLASAEDSRSSLTATETRLRSRRPTSPLQVVPEPSTFALLATTAIGLCAVMLYRRRAARVPMMPLRRVSRERGGR